MDERTVGRSQGATPDTGMLLVGVVVALGLLPILVPLAPALAAVWLLQRLRSGERPNG